MMTYSKNIKYFLLVIVQILTRLVISYHPMKKMSLFSKSDSKNYFVIRDDIRCNICIMKKIPDTRDKKSHPKCFPFKYFNHYHHSYVNHWIKIVKSPITKFCLCDILVPDSNTSINNFDWQPNESKVSIKSMDYNDNVEHIFKS